MVVDRARKQANKAADYPTIANLLALRTAEKFAPLAFKLGAKVTGVNAARAQMLLKYAMYLRTGVSVADVLQKVTT
eukprot:3907653-Rhodomonas_salina.1